jgi:hypothetical protein
MISSGSHRQARAIGPHDLDAAAGGRIGMRATPPDRIVDPNAERLDPSMIGFRVNTRPTSRIGALL